MPEFSRHQTWGTILGLSLSASTSVIVPAYNEGPAKVITIFSPLRIFLPVSLAAFGLGAAYALWTVTTQSHVTNSSVLLITLSVVIFLIGLVSEQISTLRFGGRFEETGRPEEPRA